MTEEWTLVTPSKGGSSSNQRNSRLSRRRRQHISLSGSSGLYRAAAADRDGDDYDGMKRFFDNQMSDIPPRRTSEAEKIRIRDALFKSIGALEGDNSFSQWLVAALEEEVSSSSDDEVDNYDKSPTNNQERKGNRGSYEIQEIVAYGIGNFATTTTALSLFSPPLLQLACLLFLRRRYAAAATAPSQSSSNTIKDFQNEGTTTTSTADSSSSSEDAMHNMSVFEREQNQIPIYYYEPCILPIERELLETVFYVHVLEGNDFGKRHVKSMRRRQHHQHQHAGMKSIQTRKVPKTLFYMPHCPMRLYCNVLWSHWECLDSIIMFGNSFHSYDERIISSERRNDPTNGIFRIMTCVKEVSIAQERGGRRGGGGDVDQVLFDDALTHIETAFNDCNIISFSFTNDSSSNNHNNMPDRPDEYFVSQDPKNKELL